MTPSDLRAAQARLGLTRQQLAERLGIDRKTLWGYLTGRAPMPAEVAERAAALLDGTAPPDSGRVVRIVRTRLGLTQLELATALGMGSADSRRPERTVQSWEHGVTTPPRYLLRALRDLATERGVAVPELDAALIEEKKCP